MKKAGYPDTDIHKRMHEMFMEDLTGKLKEERSGAIVLNTEVMKILTGWLQNHIKVEDRKYKDFMG